MLIDKTSNLLNYIKSEKYGGGMLKQTEFYQSVISSCYIIVNHKKITSGSRNLGSPRESRFNFIIFMYLACNFLNL